MTSLTGTDLFCLKCNAAIPSSDVNISEGVALCRGCQSFHKLGDLMNGVGNASNADITQPPAGCRVDQVGTEHVVSASARNGGVTGFFCFFAVFWNFGTLLFVSIAIVLTVTLINGSTPSWMPTLQSGQKITSGNVLFLWLFLTPFVLAGIGAMSMALYSLFGRVEVRLNGESGTIFTGVRSMGWTRRFEPSAVKSVRIVKGSWQANGRDMKAIELAGPSPKKFGSMLSEERQAWMARVLQSLLVVK